MSEEEKDRTDEVQEFKVGIKEIKGDADQIKEMVHETIADSKAMCVDVDRIEDSLTKQEIIADSLSKEVIDDIPNEEWAHMRAQFEQVGKMQKIICSLRRDMEGIRPQMSAYSTVISTSSSANMASGSSMFSVLRIHADRHPQVKLMLDKVEFSPTWMDEIRFIEQELRKGIPTLLIEFQSVVADMSASGGPNLKYKALLSLRSVIFNQLFDKVAPEALYSQTPWFRITPPRIPFRQMRFCQAKFFIIGNRDEARFPQSVSDTINKTAMELQQKFDEMSKYGKEGANSTLVDNCYKETITSFASAIKLKAEVEKSYP